MTSTPSVNDADIKLPPPFVIAEPEKHPEPSTSTSVPNPLTCHLCNMSLKSWKSLRLHRHVHVETQYRCTWGCIQTYSPSKGALNTHRSRYHNSMHKVLLGDYLPSTSDDRPSRRSFMISKATVLTCPICFMENMSAHTLGSHMRVHTPTQYACTNGCIQTFSPSAMALAQHRSRYHNNRSLWASNSAAELSPTSLSLDTPPSRRRTTTSRTTLLTCPVCSRENMTAKTLGMHIRVHTPTQYRCTRGCVKTFASSAVALSAHRARYHGKRRSGHGKKIKSRSVPDHGQSTSALPMPISTNESSVDSVRKSVSSSLPITMEQCPVCHVEMRTKSMASHRRVHVPSLYQCTRGCVETFSTSVKSLREHNRRHHRVTVSTISRDKKNRSLVSNRKRRAFPTQDSPNRFTEHTNDNNVISVTCYSNSSNVDDNVSATPTMSNSHWVRRSIRETPTVQMKMKAEEMSVNLNVSLPDEDDVVLEKSQQERGSSHEPTSTIEEPSPNKTLPSTPPPTSRRPAFEQQQDARQRMIMSQIIALPSTATAEERLRLLDEYRKCGQD